MYWEKIDEQLANDAISLEGKVQVKVEALFQQGRPTTKHVQYGRFLGPPRALQTSKGWTHCEFEDLPPEAEPRVIVFRPPHNKTSFASVRVMLEGQEHMVGGILWDLFTTDNVSADGVYTGVVPPGYTCYFLAVEVKVIRHRG